MNCDYPKEKIKFDKNIIRRSNERIYSYKKIFQKIGQTLKALCYSNSTDIEALNIKDLSDDENEEIPTSFRNGVEIHETIRINKPNCNLIKPLSIDLR